MKVIKKQKIRVSSKDNNNSSNNNDIDPTQYITKQIEGNHLRFLIII